MLPRRPSLNFLIIGDLSFFYDMNALWNVNYGSNIRILLLNNSGGEIFYALPGLELQGDAKRYVTATHTTTAKAGQKTGDSTIRQFIMRRNFRRLSLLLLLLLCRHTPN